MGSLMSENEKLALIVSSLCHDLDHRGTITHFRLSKAKLFSVLYYIKLNNYILKDWFQHWHT